MRINLTALLHPIIAGFMGGFSPPSMKSRVRHFHKVPPLTAEQRARVGAYYKARRAAADAKEQARRAGRRAVLARQNRRETDGFYDGQTSVATALSHNMAGRLHRRVKIDDTGKRKAGNLTRLG